VCEVIFMSTSAAQGEALGKAVPVSGGWMPQRTVAEFFGVSTMTLWRWERDPKMAFPRSTEINGRRYFPRAEVLGYQPPVAQQVKRPQPVNNAKKSSVAREDV
jgi:predicted DNA-binding transcriptional regulator AlpA